MANPAAQELQSYVRRIESVEDEIAALNGDKSEIYKEAKSNGFNPKTVRKVVAKRRIGEADRDEQDAEFELYWNAVHGIDRDLVRAHVENIEEFDAETGEVTERQASAADQIIEGLKEALAVAKGEAEALRTHVFIEQRPAPAARDLTTDLIPQGDSGQVATHTPEMANDNSVAHGIERPAKETEEAMRLAGHVQPNGAAKNFSSMPERTVGRTPAESQPLTREQGILKLRPNCQQPAACKSSGGKAHCWGCTKQMGATA